VKNKSLIEEILSTAIKNPVAGVIFSIFFFGVGSYLTHQRAPIDAKPNEMFFLPLMHIFGMVSYVLSVIVLICSGIALIITFVKSKLQRRTVAIGNGISDDLNTLSKNTKDVVAHANKGPKFKTKEEYFRWKEGVMKNPSEDRQRDSSDESKSIDIIDLNVQTEAPQQEQNYEPSVKQEDPAWNRYSIYHALGKIDWYQFEKFAATLLRSEGYTVKRKGGAHPDGGVDLIATKDSDSILVQCKHWKTWEIKPKIVREMIGSMTINQTSKGAIYTIKGPSKAALQLALQQKIQIEEGYGLADRALRNFSKEQLDAILRTDIHHCPKCEAEMVWREGNFKPFWGCSRYPKCVGTLKHTGAL